MKIAIIGAGNMGGAIARGLATQLGGAVSRLSVVNRSKDKLNKLKEEFPDIVSNESHQEAVDNADYVILAVKPWLVKEVIGPLKFNETQVLISVVAGITCKELQEMTSPLHSIVRLIPNTAISCKASMNIFCALDTQQKTLDNIDLIFRPLGNNLFLPEDKMAAGTAIASCGIAYLLKYIHASMQAGVELGLTPLEAKILASQAAIGAGKLLLENEDSHPAIEIDKVTTPGGLTIKGVNQLEKGGFNSTIIDAIKKSI